MYYTTPTGKPRRIRKRPTSPIINNTHAPPERLLIKSSQNNTHRARHGRTTHIPNTADHPRLRPGTLAARRWVRRSRSPILQQRHHRRRVCSSRTSPSSFTSHLGGLLLEWLSCWRLLATSDNTALLVCSTNDGEFQTPTSFALARPAQRAGLTGGIHKRHQLSLARARSAASARIPPYVSNPPDRRVGVAGTSFSRMRMRSREG